MCTLVFVLLLLLKYKIELELSGWTVRGALMYTVACSGDRVVGNLKNTKFYQKIPKKDIHYGHSSSSRNLPTRRVFLLNLMAPIIILTGVLLSGMLMYQQC